ncbi:MAG: radical SAM protein [Planctomycetota bacterium]
MVARLPLPRNIVWEATARCNYACRYCYNVWTAPGGRTREDLGGVDMRRIIETIAACVPRLRTLTFSGGEPLLRDDLTALVSETKRILPRTQLSVATNGRLLSRDKARELKEAGVTAVQITTLSANPEVHDELAGMAGALESAVAAITRAKSAGMLVAAFFVATRCNIGDLPGAAKLALATGADTVIFNRFQPGGRALAHWKELTPSVRQLETAWRQIAELRKVGGLSLATILPPCETPNLKRTRKNVMSCPIGTRNAYPAIDPAGNLRPCNHSPIVAGSLLESPFVELLAHPSMLQSAADLPAECADCRWSRRCRGGCPAARHLAGEQIYACC